MNFLKEFDSAFGMRALTAPDQQDDADLLTVLDQELLCLCHLPLQIVPTDVERELNGLDDDSSLVFRF